VKRSPRRLNTRDVGSFTLVEVLVSLVILLILMVLMSTMVTQANKAWKYNKAKTEEYRDSGDAFAALTSRLSQATLNTYWDYLNSSGQGRTAANSTNFIPFNYTRQSELRFISGPGLTAVSGANPRPTHAVFFQAPLGYSTNSTSAGLENLLNTWGYYVEYGPDPRPYPSFAVATTGNRFRLMEMMEPSDSLSLYKYTCASTAFPNGSPTYTGTNWYTDPLIATPSNAHVLAQNVIALILLPKLSPQEDPSRLGLAPLYAYNSTTTGQSTITTPNALFDSHNQLPPVVQISLVSISEESAIRMGNTGSTALLAKINTLFSNATNYTSDLRAPPDGSATSLESYLIQNKINYHIFTTDVAIKSAKWSTSQTQ
jgi:uncharacterized protein (TIGR02599 family)